MNCNKDSHYLFDRKGKGRVCKHKASIIVAGAPPTMLYWANESSAAEVKSLLFRLDTQKGGSVSLYFAENNENPTL